MNSIKDKKVLIVEDDNDSKFIISLALKINGVNTQNVTMASNGAEALMEIKKQLFDIIIMDIRMPVMDGIEATKHIRMHYNGDCPKIVAFTATNKSITIDADNLFDEYIEKPFSKKDIEDKIIKVLLEKNNS